MGSYEEKVKLMQRVNIDIDEPEILLIITMDGVEISKRVMSLDVIRFSLGNNDVNYSVSFKPVELDETKD